MSIGLCQIHCLPKLVNKQNILKKCYQRQNRIKRFAKRRAQYLLNCFKEITNHTKNRTTKEHTHSETSSKIETFTSGDVVRVKSKSEIQSTLNKWGQLKRCSFMEEMKPYYDTEQKIFKPVKQFLDERDYLMKKCNGIVILENVHCEGTKDFGDCDRSCYFFWRNEWLEKI